MSEYLDVSVLKGKTLTEVPPSTELLLKEG